VKTNSNITDEIKIATVCC